QRRVRDRVDERAVVVVSHVLREAVGGQPVDVLFALVVGVVGLLRDRVEEGVRLLLRVEREAVRQPVVGQRDVGRRRLVLDAARLLHRATGVRVAGDRARGLAVVSGGVDNRAQQTVL